MSKETIIHDFSKRYCIVDVSLLEMFERHSQQCFHLAEEWAKGVSAWMDPNSGDSLGITSIENALKATQLVVELLHSAQELSKEIPLGSDNKDKPAFNHLAREIKNNYYQNGKPCKINTIKRVRELTKCGLKEAKDFVEAIMEDDEIVREII